MGNTSVVVSLLSGSLARDVIVSLQTLNITATGESPNELTISRYLCANVGIYMVVLHDVLLQSSWNGLSRYIY